MSFDKEALRELAASEHAAVDDRHSEIVLPAFATTRGVGAFLQLPRPTVSTELRRVLIVDDDAACRRLLRQVLDVAGYEVVEAEHGESALRAFHDCPTQFVITDWDMPLLDGIELCGMLRKAAFSNYVYIVMLTGISHLQTIVRGIAAGADDVLFKPLEPGEVLARLNAGTRILELERRLREESHRDALTHLPNRRTFYAVLEDQWMAAERNRTPLSCAMIDIDCFKSVNDTHGHLLGDAVLVWVAQAVKNSLRASDGVCRYGGEEFCVVLPCTDAVSAAQWAHRCRTRIAETPFLWEQGAISLSISVGVAEKHPDVAMPDQLVDMADKALLEAKRTTKNTVVVWNKLAEPAARQVTAVRVKPLSFTGMRSEFGGD